MFDGALGSAKFRRLLAGSVATNVGDSIYFIAAMWLVYDLSGSAAYSGLAGFLTLAPSAFKFLSGPLLDRWPIRRTLVASQLIQGVVIAFIPVAAHFGLLSVELVLVVMPVLATLNELSVPAVRASLPKLLDDEDLAQANSLLSIAFQAIDMTAKGVSGAIIGLVGAVTMFAIDAVTFGVAALLFGTVYVPTGREAATEAEAETEMEAETEAEAKAEAEADEPAGDSDESYRDQLLDGASLVRGTFLMPLMVGAGVVGLANGMTFAALPKYADTLAVPPLLQPFGSVGSYGILMAGFAAGNLIGAVGVNFVDDRPLGRVMVVGSCLMAVFWSAAIALDSLLVTTALMVLAFVPVSVMNVMLAAAVQSAPPEEYVGRLTTIFASSARATLPIGSLVGGGIAFLLGPRAALAGLGVGILAFGLFVFARPELRRLPSPGAVTLATGDVESAGPGNDDGGYVESVDSAG